MATQTTIESLRDLFVDELRAAYYVETELVEELDHMARNASNEKISDGFANHREQTEGHVDRLEDVFAAIDEPPEGRTVAALDGLIEDRNRCEQMIHDDDLRDVLLVSAGMKTERMEMTMYEGLKMNARKLDLGRDVTAPLDDTLDEEEHTFQKLRTISGGSELKSMLDRLVG